MVCKFARIEKEFGLHIWRIYCAKHSLRPTAEKDRDVIFVRASVRIIITFLCAVYGSVMGAAALW